MVGHQVTRVVERPETTSYFLRKRAEDPGLAAALERAKSFAWKVRVKRGDALRAVVMVRNHSFVVGQPASFDTADPHPAAIEYFLGAVGSALAVGLEWHLSRLGHRVDHLEIALEARSVNYLVFLGLADEGTPALAGVDGKLYVDTDAPLAVLERLWADTVRGCPLTRSLQERVEVRFDLRRT